MSVVAFPIARARCTRESAERKLMLEVVQYFDELGRALEAEGRAEESPAEREQAPGP